MFETECGLRYDMEYDDHDCVTLILYRPNGRATRITKFKTVRDVMEFLGENCLNQAQKTKEVV